MDQFVALHRQYGGTAVYLLSRGCHILSTVRHPQAVTPNQDLSVWKALPGNAARSCQMMPDSQQWWDQWCELFVYDEEG